MPGGRFRNIGAAHTEKDGQTYQKDEEFDSPHDLVQMFANHFERIDDKGRKVKNAKAKEQDAVVEEDDHDEEFLEPRRPKKKKAKALGKPIATNEETKHEDADDLNAEKVLADEDEEDKVEEQEDGDEAEPEEVEERPKKKKKKKKSA